MKNIYFILVLFVSALTIFACNKDFDASGDAASGKGGSMARFCISGNTLYTVDNNSLKIFDITEPEAPVYFENRTQHLNFGVETIFAMDTLLLIGSMDGMYIYDISRPQFPQYLSYEQHIRSCDPVVAQGNYAYVTLNTENVWCGRTNNSLLVYNIEKPEKPSLVNEIRLTSPKGLGIDGNKMFVCDNGLKVYDITDPAKPRWIDDLYSTDINVKDSYDVIPVNGVLMLVASNGIFQFDYTGEKLRLLSSIEIKN